MDNRPVIVYPMLDPEQKLYFDDKGKPLFELCMTDEQGMQILFKGKPMMMHPVLNP
jgi:hypothetical protein